MQGSSWRIRTVALPEGGLGYAQPHVRVAVPNKWVARPRSRREWRLWLRWTLANVMGVVLGCVVGIIVASFLWDRLHEWIIDAYPLNSTYYDVTNGRIFWESLIFLSPGIWFFVPWVPCAVAVAAAQFIAIRGRLPNAAWRWFFLSFGGALASGYIIAQFLDKATTPGDLYTLFDMRPFGQFTWVAGTVVGGAAGAIIGGAQWLVLRWYSRRARRWVLAHALIGAACMLMIGNNYPAFNDMGHSAMPIGEAVITTVVGFMAAAITGGSLVVLLRYPTIQQRRRA